MRRDRHKFYLEAFFLMAPIAWQGSTPASNSGPQLLLPTGAGGGGLCCHHLCPATGILPKAGEEFACASKGMAMHGIKPCAFPFPGMLQVSPLIPAQQPLSQAPQGWGSSQPPAQHCSSQQARLVRRGCYGATQLDPNRSRTLGKPRAEAGRRLQSPATPVDISGFTAPAQTHKCPKSYAKSWREIRGFAASGGSGRKRFRGVRIEPICRSIWSETLNRVIFQVRISAAGHNAFLLIPVLYFTRRGDGRWH